MSVRDAAQHLKKAGWYFSFGFNQRGWYADAWRTEPPGLLWLDRKVKKRICRCGQGLTWEAAIKSLLEKI